METVVAIVGSVDTSRKYEPAIRDHGVGAQAAHELGHALAEQGVRLAVYSDESEFIESAVVSGYISSGRARPASIVVWGRYRPGGPQFAEVDEHREVFQFIPTDATEWEVGFYRSLVNADGLVLLGGGRSTFNAGLIAISLRIPLVAVASFGGGAEKAWKVLARDRNDVTDFDLSLMADDWRSSSARSLAEAMCRQTTHARQRAHDAERTNRREIRKATVGLSIGIGLLMAMLALIPLHYSVPSGSVASMAILAGAPLLAAACGAIVKNVSAGGDAWLRTTLLGSAAGVTAFLLFVAAQLTTAPEMLRGEGAHRLLFFVLPVAFVAGLTFEAVYARLRSQEVLLTSALAKPETSGDTPNTATFNEQGRR